MKDYVCNDVNLLDCVLNYFLLLLTSKRDQTQQKNTERRCIKGERTVAEHAGNSPEPPEPSSQDTSQTPLRRLPLATAAQWSLQLPVQTLSDMAVGDPVGHPPTGEI